MSERRPNRLAREPSPYLRQHAYNPVDWYPWGTEALEKARHDDKPILLSIGYSACHWCHVMERESFENDDIARQMNQLFIPIKVDREERPDLDHVYQLVVQLMGRSGGWPLTVFLTPDQRPFFGGTYFPPIDRHGMPGFGRVLDAIAAAYRVNRSHVESQADQFRDAIENVYRSEPSASQSSASQSSASEPSRAELPYDALPVRGPDLLEKVAHRLVSRFDDTYGGFGPAPKFPNVMCLELLLRRGVDEGDAQAASRVRLALDSMRRGGIWDHLAGGFHRYATDERWLVPHFEKMLYDNALLLRLYVDAVRAFGDRAYAQTASDLGAYLIREMQSDLGGFYSSQDADSAGREGTCFVWTDSEIRELLAGDPLAIDVVRRYFGIDPAGNFESTGACVLAQQASIEQVAEALGRLPPEVSSALDRATSRLREARAERPAPSRDEKILASWNGLAIAALADAAAVLGDRRLLVAAERAFTHVEQALVRGGKVDRLVKDGIVRGPGFLDDHAFFCLAALGLFEVTGDRAKLTLATAVADEILSRFWIPADGVFSFAPSDAPPLIVRVEDRFDQAAPSGSAMASLALLKLGAVVDEHYSVPAAAFLEKVAASALANPFAYGQTIAAIDRLVRGSTDILIAGDANDPRTQALHRVALRAYVPNRNLAIVDPSDPQSLRAVPLLTRGRPMDSVPLVYVCRDRTCSAPLRTEAELVRALEPR